MKAIEMFQELIWSMPTREIELEESIVGSVPDFQAIHLEQINDFVQALMPWIELQEE